MRPSGRPDAGVKVKTEDAHADANTHRDTDSNPKKTATTCTPESTVTLCPLNAFTSRTPGTAAATPAHPLAAQRGPALAVGSAGFGGPRWGGPAG